MLSCLFSTQRKRASRNGALQRVAAPILTVNTFASRGRSWIVTKTALGILRFSSRRNILVYLFAIVGPTVVLLYLGLQSVQRQREAITNLTLSNLRLSGERLAAELERRAAQLAEACLRDEAWTGLQTDSLEAATPPAIRQLRAGLDRIKDRHPIVRQFFVIQDNTVRYPALHTPLPQRLEEFLAREDSGGSQEFTALFKEGEIQEIQNQHSDLALASYRKCAELPVSNAAKALALVRVARCLAKGGQPWEAEETYRALLEKHGETYDLSHRPYALVAALELGDLLKTQSPSRLAPLAGVRGDLVRGRWELSAEQTEYFLTRLQERLNEPLAPPPNREWRQPFELARALEESFAHSGSLQTNVVYAAEVSHRGTHYQTFFALSPLVNRAQSLLGFAVDLDWVKNELLPRTRRELGLADTFRIAERPEVKVSNAAEGSDLRVGFQKLFPFWNLSAAAVSGQILRLAARRDTLIFAGVVLLILSVLVLGVALLLRDVSREMQLNRLRGDFVSGVSHELKTPLTLIRLYGETLLYGENFPDEERRNYYQIITRESERLTQLIEKVLDFSRIERGQKQYRLQEGDLAAAVASTVEVYKQYLQRQGFSLESDLAADLPPVRFDTDAVSEAVLNLIDNAAKYSGESKRIAVRLYAQDGQVRFEVRDYGVGIPESERDKIFQQFYRGPQRKEKGGYGLGLYLVKHIIDAHRGRIEVESEVGQGSLFRLVFPTSNVDRGTSTVER